MSKKILFCASTISHIKNFHLPYLKVFNEKGYEVWVVANKVEQVPYADHVISLNFYKKILSVKNLKAILAAKRLLREQNFDIISTHTTLASAIIRAAIILMHRKPKVFCTVHGYLFNENDGLKKWIYLLPEKICASVTNVLMVMNHEDYIIAEKNKLYQDKLYYIDGMGIDLTRFNMVSKEERFELRKKLGFSGSDYLFVYAAEFSKRKNQTLLINAFAKVCKEYPNLKLLLAGEGVLQEDCKVLSYELKAEEQILFLGYVKDMKAIYSMCDACVTTSRIEGLPFNVMEAMACGLPVIASKIKGHVELLSHERTGKLFELEDQEGLEEALINLYLDKEKQAKCVHNELINIHKYELGKVSRQIMTIYQKNIRI